MIVYLFVLILAVTLANAADRRPITVDIGVASKRRENSRKFNIFVLLTILLLVLVAGLRKGVGQDYWGYFESFARRSSRWWDDLWKWEEPGAGFLGAVSGLIYNNPATMFFNVSLITVTFYVVTIRKNTDDFALSIALYLLLGCWHNSFNGIRQYLAAAILFLGHRYMFDRKIVKWAIIVFIASLFHRTSIIMFPIYFVADKKLDWKRVLIIAAGTIALLLSSDVLFSIMGELKGHEQQGYAYMERGVKPLRILVCFAPLVLAVLKGKEFYKDPENAFYVKMLIVNAGFMFATAGSSYLARVGIFTEMYATLAFPRLLSDMKPKNRNIWIAIIIGFYIIYWWYEISRRSELVNWRWIFN